MTPYRFVLRSLVKLALVLTMLAHPATHAQDMTPGNTFSAPTYSSAEAASAAGNGRAGDVYYGNDVDQLAGPADTASSPRRGILPARATQFQRFVLNATGQRLPIFGSSFFVDAMSSVVSADSAPVSSDYTVSPGDELLIRAWGSIDVNFRTAVDRSGQISLPKVGTITVAGVKASELEPHLRAQIGRIYKNFNLSVSLGKLRGVKVFVVGPARVPGVYTVPSQSTLLSAIVAAGGPAPTGSMRKVLLRRAGATLAELDIYDFLVRGDKSKDVQLINGDVIVFQSAGPRVAISGTLDTPAIFELKAAQEPLGDVLGYAGGKAVLADPNKALIERIDAEKKPAARFVEEVRLDNAGLQRPLRDGDVITLLPISPKIANAVTLKGHVAQPLRHAYTLGMRVRDLIPNRDALISPDFYRRKNVLVQFDGDPRYDSRNGNDARTGNEPGLRMDRGNLRASQISAQRPMGAASAAMQDRLAAEQAKRTATLFEELNWDYAVIERLKPDLSTQVISFNLGKAVLQGDDASNVELLPGDVVTVFSQKDIQVPITRQTRMVSVEGEVGAPGVYQLRPGETLAHLVDRAGGFTAEAYVYGMEFTREETRRRQRENLDAAIARLEALAAVQTARDAANKSNEANPNDRTSSVSAAATQAQLSRLHRVQPNGRIALELNPNDSTIAALPEVLLENGDRVIVPSRPGSINVVGAVLNNNALLWRPGRTIGEYVKQAGVDESAEPANMFVLRADGTVLSARNQRSFLGFGGFDSQRVQPGDAIVVPTQLDFETWGRTLVRNLKDFSQIFAQFGLGAAAIQTLRNN